MKFNTTFLFARLPLTLLLTFALSGCASTAAPRLSTPWGFDANGEAIELAFEVQSCQVTGCYPLD
jgi:hypothetical protein